MFSFPKKYVLLALILFIVVLVALKKCASSDPCVFLKQLSLLAPIGTFTIALCAFFVAKKQLKLNAFKNEFDIFLKLDEKQKTMGSAMLRYDNIKEDENKSEEDKEYEKSQALQAEEEYLNTLDTVCFYVLNGSIDKDIFYRQYGTMLQEIKKHLDTDKFENIRKVIQDLDRVVG